MSNYYLEQDNGVFVIKTTDNSIVKVYPIRIRAENHLAFLQAVEAEKLLNPDYVAPERYF